MTELDVGPIDYLAVEFPGSRLRGQGLAALLDLVERGIIRILDLRVARRTEEGDIVAVALTDLDHDGTLDLAVFEGVGSGLLDDEDLAQSVALVAPGDAVGLIVYENTWAGPFVTAMREAGAQVIASGRIPVEDVVAVLDALEAEQTAPSTTPTTQPEGTT
ncbi:DUF6325 family protein [Promicromonospora sp. MEB111]|uniref:DUF6325 family protein n=1 Tax=unclassified Promicromonospora TaxID=2647929 RepID=UPI00254C454F|nr:DUF6325 family protein [Promicromonospora sp. MEB111]